MIWLTWRQFRTQATAVYAAVAVAALTLAITGPRLVRLAGSDGNLFDRLTDTDRSLFYGGVVVLAVAPVVIGIFWGAPLVARELEHGTHRLAWNQSVTRTRWLATKLGVTAVGTAVALGVLTLAVTWWSHPIDGAMSSTRGGLPSRLTPVTFAMRGIVPIGYAVFALVLGATLGIVLRRSLPAMAITLTVYTLMQVTVPLMVRPYLVSAVHESVTISNERIDGISADESGRPMAILANTGHQGDWVLSNDTVNAKGQVTALPAWFGDCLPAPGGPADVKVPVRANIEPCFTRLADEGYRQRLVYQPANHFWPLQWAETGGYLALSALLATLCFWWTRRRLS